MDPTTDGFFVPDHSYNGKYTSLRTMGCGFESRHTHLKLLTLHGGYYVFGKI